MITSQKLKSFANISHGFSTKDNHDLSNIKKSEIRSARQVHGTKIAIIHKHVNKNLPDADGLVTKLKNLSLAVKTADCVPLLFYDPVNKIIGVAHSGWKGTLGNITKETIEAMKILGAREKNLLVVLGPHIKKCCYNIDKEREILFRNNFPSNTSLISYRNGMAYLNLSQAITYQLKNEGISQNNIEIIPLCTAGRPDLFFSYRRDKNNAGRMINFICQTN